MAFVARASHTTAHQRGIELAPRLVDIEFRHDPSSTRTHFHTRSRRVPNLTSAKLPAPGPAPLTPYRITRTAIHVPSLTHPNTPQAPCGLPHRRDAPDPAAFAPIHSNGAPGLAAAGLVEPAKRFAIVRESWIQPFLRQ